MQVTYKGQTAGGVLKTASIQQMRAGTWEILVTTKDGQQHLADIGVRADGWGGTVQDVLVLSQIEGVTARLEMSDAALKKMEVLQIAREKSYK